MTRTEKLKRARGRFTLSGEVRQVIDQRARTIGLSKPVPSFLWATQNDDGTQRLFLAFYENERLPVSDPVFLVELDDGLEVLILQEELLQGLEGRTIVLRDGSFEIS